MRGLVPCVVAPMLEPGVVVLYCVFMPGDAGVVDGVVPTALPFCVVPVIGAAWPGVGSRGVAFWAAALTAIVAIDATISEFGSLLPRAHPFERWLTRGMTLDRGHPSK